MAPSSRDRGETEGLLFEEAIEKIGMGFFQYKLLFVCGLGWIADTMEMVVFAYCLPYLTSEWPHITNFHKGVLVATAYFGMAVGAVCWSYLSDSIGRRATFVASLLFVIVFGVLSAFATSVLWFGIYRFWLGFGVGGNLPVDFTIFSEYIPASKCNSLITLLGIFQWVGNGSSAVLAWIVLPRLGWRWFLVFSALPSILILFLRGHIPESPTYLMSKGKLEDARAVLETIAAENQQPCPHVMLHQPAMIPRDRTFVRLFGGSFFKATILLWLIWFLSNLAHGIFHWLPTLLLTRGLQVNHVFQFMLLIAFAQLCGIMVFACCGTRLTQRFLLAAALFTAGAILVAFTQSYHEVTTVCCFLAFFCFLDGALSSLNGYTAELYPTNIRAEGFSYALTFKRLAGVGSPIIVGTFLDDSLAFVCAIFATGLCVASVCCCFMPDAVPASLHEEEEDSLLRTGDHSDEPEIESGALLVAD